MTDLRNQKRLAAAVLGRGESGVWLDPLKTDEIAEAVTRQDIRALIKKGVIRPVQKIGVSRARANKIAEQKEKGRRKGPGSRKGKQGARDPRKRRWIRTIRPLRALLKELRDGGKIQTIQYRRLYLQAKGGRYRSRANLLYNLKTEGILKEEQ
ncbi:MAG TPA: 50S ribosomal protein L19e [Candidatus Thermoplasmatota archaeon]|nr:50S ribosomal protein L19e [Candidatus Thermoplasmatota archaeon]